MLQLPGLHGPSGAGPSVYGGLRAPTVSDLARAAAEGEPPPPPLFSPRAFAILTRCPTVVVPVPNKFTWLEPSLARCFAGETVSIPGLAPSVGTHADLEAFLRGQPRGQPQFLPPPGTQRPPDAFAGFEEAYKEGLQRPPTPFPHSIINGDRGELRPFLQVTAAAMPQRLTTH